jgi:hypothetical protein
MSHTSGTRWPIRIGRAQSLRHAYGADRAPAGVKPKQVQKSKLHMKIGAAEKSCRIKKNRKPELERARCCTTWEGMS